MRHRIDFLPFFTSRKDFDGSWRLQVLSILEPIFPTSKSIERDYSPIWSLWRAERNPKTGANSRSLLWNLYRRDKTPESKKISLLFGLFQYESQPDGRRWRVCYVPLGKAKKARAGKSVRAKIIGKRYMFQSLGEMLLLFLRTVRALPLAWRHRRKVFDQFS